MATEREAHRSHSPAIRNFLPGSYERSEFPGNRYVINGLTQSSAPGSDIAYDWTYLNDEVLCVIDEQLKLINARSGEVKTLIAAKSTSLAVAMVSPQVPEKAMVQINGTFQKIDLISGTLALIFENSQGFSEVIFDNLLNLVLVERYRDDGGHEYLSPPDGNLKSNASNWVSFLQVSVNDEPWTQIYKINAENCRAIGSYSLGGNLAKLVSISLKDPSDVRILFCPQDRDVDLRDAPPNFAKPFYHPLTNEPVVVYENTGIPYQIALDPSVMEDLHYMDRISMENIHRGGFTEIMSSSLNFQRWVFKAVSDTKPYQYYLYDRRTRKVVYLFPEIEALMEYDFARMVPIVVRTRDEKSMHGYVTLPVGSDIYESLTPKEPLPTIVMSHEGPWFRDSWGWDSTVQFFANRGFAVLQYNMRASAGYGKKWLIQGYGQWGKAMNNDLIDAAKWAIEDKITDPNRVAVFGPSYGGYATLAALAFSPPGFFACGVARAGPTDLNELISNLKEEWKPYANLMKLRVGGDPDTEDGKEFLKDISPRFFAEKFTVPVMIAHGTHDLSVPIQQSRWMVEELKTFNRSVTYLEVDKEGHYFEKNPTSSATFFGYVEKFFSKMLQEAMDNNDEPLESTAAVKVVEQGIFGVK